MVAAIENEETRLIRELNDLVRGSTLKSDQAIAELRGVVDAHDKALQAQAQLRHDVDAMATDFRKGIKQILARNIDGPTSRGSYRGGFASRDQARHFGLAFLGHVLGMESARKRLAEEGVEIRAMGEGTDSAGGFLVPEEFQASIIRLVELYGVFRRNVLVVPMSRDRQLWPKRTGGLTVYCPGEGVAPTKSDVTLGQVALTAKKWMTLTAVSRELEEDAAIAIAELVLDEIALALATKEDLCGFKGDGTSTYFGITGVLGHGSTTNQACAATDTTFALACKWKYLTGCIGSLPTWALLRARYYFHRSVFWQHVVGQVDSSGQPIVKFVTTAGSDAPLQLGGATPLLLGFPVELVDCLPTTADTAISTVAWLFGSLWRSWMLGARREMTIDQSKEFLFDTDQVAVRGVQRVDIVASAAEGVCKTTTAAA